MIIGEKFNALTYVKCLGSGRGLFFCEHDAVYKEIRKADVKRGRTKSCGCQMRAHQRVGSPTHGMSGSPSHTSWKGLLARSRNPERFGYDYSIDVSPDWDPQQGGSFENFIRDMGERPAGSSIDRYPDPRGPYSADNCRWATKTQQGENQINPGWYPSSTGVRGLIRVSSRGYLRAQRKLGGGKLNTRKFPDTQQGLIDAQAWLDE